MRNLLLLLLLFPIIASGQSQNNEYGKNKGWSLYNNYNYYLKKIHKDVLGFFYFKSITNKQEIAITFDDGPLKNTKDIIDFLLQNDLPATFFVVADKLNDNNIILYEDTLIEVGMHTYSHLDYSNLKKYEKEKDINKCIEIFNKYNLKTNYFRPAYGVIDRDIYEILYKKSLKGIIWSIDSQDWNGYKKEKLINNIISNISNGSIILFHDRIDVEDLVEIIKEIHVKGFKIVSLSELIKYNSEMPTEIQLDND